MDRKELDRCRVDVAKPAPYRPRVVCEVRDHAPVLHGGGAVQRGLEGDALVVDHHHPRHVPARLLSVVSWHTGT